MSIFVPALVGERMEESAGNRRTGQRRDSPRFKSFGSSGDYPVTQDSSLKKKKYDPLWNLRVTESPWCVI